METHSIQSDSASEKKSNQGQGHVSDSESEPVDSDSDTEPGRVVTGLFGMCTFCALVSLLWLITGNPWLVALVVTAVAFMFMLENLAFFEEIRMLEKAAKLQQQQIEFLKLVSAAAIPGESTKFKED